MEIIDYGEDEHFCEKSGWWKRRRLGLKYGAIIQCECGRKYILRDGFDGRLN